jgi:hypothetical protein
MNERGEMCSVSDATQMHRSGVAAYILVPTELCTPHLQVSVVKQLKCFILLVSVTLRTIKMPYLIP